MTTAKKLRASVPVRCRPRARIQRRPDREGRKFYNEQTGGHLKPGVKGAAILRKEEAQGVVPDPPLHQSPGGRQGWQADPAGAASRGLGEPVRRRSRQRRSSQPRAQATGRSEGVEVLRASGCRMVGAGECALFGS